MGLTMNELSCTQLTTIKMLTEISNSSKNAKHFYIIMGYIEALKNMDEMEKKEA